MLRPLYRLRDLREKKMLEMGLEAGMLLKTEEAGLNIMLVWASFQLFGASLRPKDRQKCGTESHGSVV